MTMKQVIFKRFGTWIFLLMVVLQLEACSSDSGSSGVTNQVPVVAVGQNFSVAEDVAISSNVGTVTGSDTDAGDTLQNWQIVSGNTGNAFVIDANTGVIRVATNLDYETTSSYSLGVSVSDGTDTSASETVTINITNANDVPVVNAGQGFSIAENAAISSNVGTVTGSDADVGDTLQNWQIVSGNTGNAFVIDANTGVISVAAALDYETIVNFSLGITMSDGTDASATETVSITLTNVNEAPTATTDSLTTTGNTRKTFTAPGVLANDSDVDSPSGGLTVTAGTIFTTNGGSVNMSSDGSFVYTPPVGATSDSFNYTLNDNDSSNPLSSVGMVTITMNDMVWYVDDSVAAGGNGTSASPFNTLAAAALAASSGETIFAYAGNYTGGITLTTAGQLIGEGEGLDVDGLTIPASMAPTITAGDTIDVITLASGNTIKGLSITGGQRGIFGDGISGLMLQNTDFSNTGDDSISLVAASGTVTITDSSITATTATPVIGLFVDNTGRAATLTLNVSNTTFTGLGDSSGGGLDRAIYMPDRPANAGVVEVNVTGSTFIGSYGDAIALSINSSTVGNAVTIGDGVNGNSFTASRGNAMNLRAEDNSNATYTILGNVIDGSGRSVSHGIELYVFDGATVSADVSGNSITDVGNDTVFNDSLSTDDMAIRILVGNTSSAFSDASLRVNNNTLTSNNARGIVIDAYGSSTAGVTVNDNTISGHLGDNGLDVLTSSGTTLCLAASGNDGGSSSDQIELEEAYDGSGNALTVTGVANVFALSSVNNGMPVSTTGGVAYATCTP